MPGKKAQTTINTCSLSTTMEDPHNGQLSKMKASSASLTAPFTISSPLTKSLLASTNHSTGTVWAIILRLIKNNISQI